MLPGFTAESATYSTMGTYYANASTEAGPRSTVVGPQLAVGGTSIRQSCCCGNVCSAPMYCPWPRCRFTCICGSDWMTASCRCGAGAGLLAR